MSDLPHRQIARAPLTRYLHEACRAEARTVSTPLEDNAEDRQMAAMKFYMTPGSCSTGIHIILEELEEIFEVTIVNLPAGDHFKPDYVAINPKSTIPALVRKDGSVLTELPAIAYWLGRAHPRSKLWPADIESRDARDRSYDLYNGDHPRPGVRPDLRHQDLFAQSAGACRGAGARPRDRRQRLCRSSMRRCPARTMWPALFPPRTPSCSMSSSGPTSWECRCQPISWHITGACWRDPRCRGCCARRATTRPRWAGLGRQRGTPAGRNPARRVSRRPAGRVARWPSRRQLAAQVDMSRAAVL